MFNIQIRLVIISLIFFINQSNPIKGASCNADQQQICLHAVVQKRLSWLSAGGECFSKQYVQFTHLCTVYNYLPTIDYCCCALTSSLTSPTTSSEDQKKRIRHDRFINNKSQSHELELTSDVHADDEGEGVDEDDNDDEAPEAALCCRYHQTWNHFRCLESEDAVRTSSEPTTQPFFERFIIWDLSVISLILGLVSIFVSCLVCCFKFWKCRKGGKGEAAEVTAVDLAQTDFATKTKVDLLDDLEPPPYNKTELSTHLRHDQSYSLQFRQQPTSSDQETVQTPVNESDFTMNDRHLHQLYHIFSSVKSQDACPSTCERDIVMRSSFGRRLKPEKSEKRCCSGDLDEYNDYSSLSCSSDSLRSDATSDTDCDKLNRYSFYRRRILSSDTRLSPSFQNSSNKSRRTKNSFPRFYRHHHHHRSHQLPTSAETTRFLSNGQIFMSGEERLKFLERVLKCQIENKERKHDGKMSTALACFGKEEGTNEN